MTAKSPHVYFLSLLNTENGLGKTNPKNKAFVVVVNLFIASVRLEF